MSTKDYLGARKEIIKKIYELESRIFDIEKEMSILYKRWMNKEESTGKYKIEKKKYDEEIGEIEEELKRLQERLEGIDKLANQNKKLKIKKSDTIEKLNLMRIITTGDEKNSGASSVNETNVFTRGEIYTLIYLLENTDMYETNEMKKGNEIYQSIKKKIKNVWEISSVEEGNISVVSTNEIEESIAYLKKEHSLNKRQVILLINFLSNLSIIDRRDEIKRLARKNGYKGFQYILPKNFKIEERE